METVITVTDISQAQSIPPRFLEQILSKLRAGGYVESRRGNQGGYVMTVSPSSISVGEIIRFVEGADESVDCLKKSESNHCPFNNTCVFRDLWQRAKSAVSDIFDATTFQDLVDKHRKSKNHSDYSI